VGGYDASRDILDDQDLMCRLYQRTEFHHLPECLYLQRMHSENTQWQSETNARIQRETVHLYDQNVEANALAWAGRRRLLALDVGPPEVRPPGYGGLAGAGNASEPDDGRFPLPDQSVGVLRAVDVLHRLADPVAWFNEAHRVLAHGGLLLSSTPSTDGRAAFQDPLARSYFNENSFWYYTNREFTRYLPALSARFQESRLTTGYPSADDEESDRSYVTANLVALHDGPRQGGLLLS
jgi:SAM-dependent methyltransferase